MRLGNKVPGFQVLLLFFISTDASDQTFRADHDSLTSTGPQDPEMYDTNNIFKPQVFLDTTQLNLIWFHVILFNFINDHKSFIGNTDL